MPRPIWSGAISFGLVNVPVKLLTAVRKQDVRFHQLHAADGVRIQQRRICPEDGREVAWDDIVKGYEMTPGRYVAIRPDELEALDPKSGRTVDIEDFVPLDQIDPLYFDTSYYLVPDPAGTKAYRLLLQAMADAGRVGIGRVVLRTKQYLCAVRPLGDALVLTTMSFADEVQDRRELDGLPGPDVAASDRELAMAGQLIESLAADFEPERYQDTHRRAVLELIEAKAAGQELHVQPEAPSAPVIDLMAALEASLAQARAGKKAGKGAGSATGGKAAGRTMASGDGGGGGLDGEGRGGEGRGGEGEGSGGEGGEGLDGEVASAG